ncbi:MAG: DUF4357 domain-containing protein, partial [Cellulomonadaceae bacterium]
HRKVIDGAVPDPSGRLTTLTRDVVFTSPSAAAAVVQGNATANGLRMWVDRDGVTFGAWQTRDVE